MVRLNGTTMAYVMGARRSEKGWVKPKPQSFALHFRNEAARRRTIAKLKAQGVTLGWLEREGFSLIAYAAAKDIVRVPIYEGAPMILASKAMAVYRSDQRRLGL